MRIVRSRLHPTTGPDKPSQDQLQTKGCDEAMRCVGGSDALGVADAPCKHFVKIDQVVDLQIPGDTL